MRECHFAPFYIRPSHEPKLQVFAKCRREQEADLGAGSWRRFDTVQVASHYRGGARFSNEWCCGLCSGDSLVLQHATTTRRFSACPSTVLSGATCLLVPIAPRARMLVSGMPP